MTFRPIAISDLDFMMRLVGDSETTRYIPGLIQDRSMMCTWIENLPDTDHEFIVLADDDQIGECNLTVYNNEAENRAEIGFMLLSQYWNQGYGTQVVSSLLRFAEVEGIQHVIAETDVANGAAIRVLEKNGFIRQHIGWMMRLTGEVQTVVAYSREIDCTSPL